MLACLGTPDLMNVLFFWASWQTIYYENAISSLSPINLLLLLLYLKRVNSPLSYWIAMNDSSSHMLKSKSFSPL